jgi:hypothetical protein
MTRHLVDINGRLFPLIPASELRGCTFPASEIGYPKEAALKGWFKFTEKANIKFASDRKKGEIAPGAMCHYYYFPKTDY